MRTAASVKRVALVLAVLGVSGTLFAQDAPPGAQPQAAPPPAPALTPEELDTLTAPVALYPDALLSQVLMASTYPLEVVEAQRFVQSNSNLTGDALANALNQQSWDPSVKSLVNTPSVLQMLDDKLDWTIKLGDAFLAQQQDVMASVQRLRRDAQQAGNLQTTPQQTVTYETGDNSAAQPYVVINDVDPDYAYVPIYDPFSIYGVWPYHSHPWFWHPHDYVPTRGIWWGDRYQYGPAWGYAWGRPDWHDHHIDVDVNRNATFNPHIDRNVYITQYDHDTHANAPAKGAFAWQHDPAHRLGVSYADPRVAREFGGRTAAQDVRSREQYRGRVDNSVAPQPNGLQHAAPNARIEPNADANARAAANARTDEAQRAANDHATNDRPTEVRSDDARERDARANAAKTDADRPTEVRPSETDTHQAQTPPVERAAPDRSAPDRSTPDRSSADRSSSDRGGAFEGSNERGGDVSADTARGEQSRGAESHAAESHADDSHAEPHSAPAAAPEPSHGGGGGGPPAGGGGPHGGGGHH